MFHMPMSSPMMTTMLGFCCADAGAVATNTARNDPIKASQSLLPTVIALLRMLLSERFRPDTLRRAVCSCRQFMKDARVPAVLDLGEITAA